MTGASHETGCKTVHVARIPDDQWQAARDPLPRMRPVDGPWITVDVAYVGQCALRQRLLDERRSNVFYAPPDAGAACADLVAVMRETLSADPRFGVEGKTVHTPDGRSLPLQTFEDLAGMLAEDLVLIERRPEGHVLAAAILCFPASWTLAEKAGKPLPAVHGPVESYTPQIAARVDRLFDGVQPGRPLWRANLHAYDDPSLFHPRTEGDPRPNAGPEAPWWRSERQTVLRLPRTRAVLFAIHTSLAPRREAAGEDIRTALAGSRPPPGW